MKINWFNSETYFSVIKPVNTYWFNSDKYVFTNESVKRQIIGSISVNLTDLDLESMSLILEQCREFLWTTWSSFYMFTSKKHKILLSKFGKRYKKDENKIVKELFFIFQTKNCLCTSTFIFPTISWILKTKFHGFWTQTWRNL